MTVKHVSEKQAEVKEMTAEEAELANTWLEQARTRVGQAVALGSEEAKAIEETMEKIFAKRKKALEDPDKTQEIDTKKK